MDTEDVVDETYTAAEDELDEDLFVARCAEQGDEDAISVSEYEDSITECIEDHQRLHCCTRPPPRQGRVSRL